MPLRLAIKTTRVLVPFGHQPLLTGVIHNWLGWNDPHGKISLYSFSGLEGAVIKKGGLSFPEGSRFFFCAHQSELVKQWVAGVMSDQHLFQGLSVSEIALEEEPDFSRKEVFHPGSPIFLKRQVGDRTDQLLLGDPGANACLKEILESKMKDAGLTGDKLDVSFDTFFRRAGTKLMTWYQIGNGAGWCPVSKKSGLIPSCLSRIRAWANQSVWIFLASNRNTVESRSSKVGWEIPQAFGK